MLSRRRFVASTAATWLCAGLPFARADNAVTKAAAGAPRYFVTFFLRGGLDAIYTMDPKVKTDVEARVDVPYGANDIVDAGGLQFGPHFKPLQKWAPNMAVLRGIQVKTANHETGAFQMMRMRSRVTTTMPTMHEVIGQVRDGQPLATVTLGELSSFEHSPGSMAAPTGGGASFIDALDDLSNDDIAVLAKVYQGHLKRIGSWDQSATTLQTREYVSQAAAFFDRLQTVPRFGGGPAGAKGKAGRVSTDFERTLWFLENDLTRSVAVKVFFDWDSHYKNAEKQTQSTSTFVALLDTFLSELKTRKNRFGSLADQTVVVIGSELGRFPVLNTNEGKDHWPETSFMLMGPGINTGGGKGGSFGTTGPFMEGKKMNKTTGKPDEAGSHVRIDDVGTTLLSLAGFKPEVYGYQGDRLRFLEQA